MTRKETMKDKRVNRRDYTDSQIMDALDRCDYNLYEASKFLGIATSTFRNWVVSSDNINKYLKYKQADGALKAREKLEYMLDNLDALDPRQAGVVKDICKTLLDKYEPDLTKSEVDTTVSFDEVLDDKIKKLLEG